MTDESFDNHLPPCYIVEKFLAPVVAGTMVEQWLLGIICSQAVMYFRHHFNSDTIFCRSIVTCLVAFTILLGILDFVALYRRLVPDYGNCYKFDLQDWILWAEPAFTAWIGFVAHIFYIFRCWAVTRSLAVCIFLGVVALNALVSGITVTVYCFAAGRLSNRAGVVTPATVWFISTSVCDMGIAIVLVIYLWGKQSVLRSTNTMINRLRWTSIETGSPTAMCALLNLFLFAAMPERGYDLLFQYSISHLYTISVLYTLLGRQDLRHILHEGAGTFVTDFRNSFLAAGVLSPISSESCSNEDEP